MGAGLVEGDDDGGVEAGLREQLEPGGQVGEEAGRGLRTHDARRMAVEGHEDALGVELAGGSADLIDHGTVPDVDTVEGADREHAALAGPRTMTEVSDDLHGRARYPGARRGNEPPAQQTGSLVTTTTPVRRSTALVVVVLSLAGLLAVGLPDGALGVAWPSIQSEFDRPLGSLGWLLTAWTIGYLSGSALSGPVSVRAGTGRLLIVAGLASIVGYLGYTLVPSWVGLILFSVVLGAGGGTLDASINAHVAVTGSLRLLNLLHAAYGVGATLAPILLTVVLHVGGSWRVAYAMLGSYAVLLTVGFIVTRDRWSRPSVPDLAGEVPRRPRLHPSRRGLAGITLATFFVYVGVEATAGRWSYTLFTEGRGMPEAAAGLWAGAFWFALTMGRLVSVGAAGRLRAERLIELGIAGMVLGSALLWWNPAPAAGGIGLVLVGFSAAPIFPTFVHLTPSRLGEDAAAHAIGFQVAMSGVAAAAVPTVVGVLAGHVGLEVVAPAMLLGSLVLVGLHRVATATAARHGSAT